MNKGVPSPCWSEQPGAGPLGQGGSTDTSPVVSVPFASQFILNSQATLLRTP